MRSSSWAHVAKANLCLNCFSAWAHSQPPSRGRAGAAMRNVESFCALTRYGLCSGEGPGWRGTGDEDLARDEQAVIGRALACGRGRRSTLAPQFVDPFLNVKSWRGDTAEHPPKSSTQRFMGKLCITIWKARSTTSSEAPPSISSDSAQVGISPCDIDSAVRAQRSHSKVKVSKFPH